MKNYFNKLKEFLFDGILNNKIFLVFLLCFFVIGLIVAVISFVSFKDYISLYNLSDKLLLNHILHNFSGFKYFILKLLVYILIFFVVLLLCSNNILKYFISLIILYLSYNLLFNFLLITYIFGLFGCIFAIVNILIIGLINIALIIIFALICLQAKFEYNCYNYFNSIYSILPVLLVIVAGFVVVLFLQALLIPILSNTFVIIYE